MEIKFSLVDILSLIALLMGLLYNFQILTLKNRTKATSYFSFYLFNITFIILFFFLLRMGLDYILKFVTPLLIFSELIMPISLYIYLRKITQSHDKKKYLRHYITPIIASVIILIILLIVVLNKDKALDVFLSTLLISYVLFIMTIGFLVLNVIYLILSFRLLYRHQKLIRNYYSYTQKVDLNWVKLMLFAYIFLLVGLILSNISNLDWTDYVFYGVLIVFIIFIGHNALKQKNIWTEDKQIPNNKIKNEVIDDGNVHELENESENYTDSQLELFKVLKDKLVLYMEEEKPYLDQDLSILKLAKDLGTNTKYLSHVINTEFNQNFINYINEFRISDVKEKLLAGNLNLTIEAIAQNAGFKSKSSFNAAFKKSTGSTPSNFMQKNS
jgi:AraC-like DNA-binding protein